MSLVAPFAAIEQLVNAETLGALSNALVRIGAGEEQLAIFDQEYLVADVGGSGMAASGPAITVPTSSIPAVYSRVPVEVSYLGVVTRWRITEHHPDGTGMSVVLLERSA